MSIRNLKSIFLGATPKPFREYFAYILDQKGNNLSDFYFTCAGKFTNVNTALHHGATYDQIHASDISLFSSTIGYFYSEEHDLNELQLEILDEDYDWIEEYFGTKNHAGAIMFLIKQGQLDEHIYYERQCSDEMKDKSDDYIKQVQSELNNLSNLAGINYGIKDMWSVIEEHRNEPDALLYVDPPGYSGGYKKMFESGGIYKWKAPNISPFDPKSDYERLFALLIEDSESFSILQLPKGIENLPDKYQDNAVFGSQRSSNERYDYLVTNRPEGLKRWTKVSSRTEIESSKYPQLPEDHEITRDSKVRFEKIKEGEAMYYRDLWAHRLGATKSEQHYAQLVDGYLISVCGIYLQNILLGKKNYIHETYGFSTPSDEYPWLNKLLMRSLISSSFKEYLMSNANFLIYDPQGLMTACIAQYPELKTNRGILDLVERDEWDNNQYYLKYYADFPEQFTYQDGLNWWMDKREARIEREIENG